MMYLGIDPGKTTGLALMEGNDFVGGMEAEGLRQLGLLLQKSEAECWVCEEFRTVNPRVNARDPVEAIGVVKYLAAVYGIPLIFQPAACAKGRYDETNFWHKSKHVRMAAAHVLHYYYTHRDL